MADEHIAKLEETTWQLQQALMNETKRRQIRDEAKKVLADREAQNIVAGVEGKNAQERDAYLRQALASEHNQLADAEADLLDAQMQLEFARLDHQLARYTLRYQTSLNERT